MCKGVKIIIQDALGAMTFGAYHQYTTNKIMELHNEKQLLQQKYFMFNLANFCNIKELVNFWTVYVKKANF